MPDDDAAIQLTVLGQVEAQIEAVDDPRLAAMYAYPDDLRTCWVRGNMISSLDGGATDDGKAGGLAGAGDRAVFKLMRETADVILVGAATVRVENYSGAQLSVAQRRVRQRRGQAEVPPIAVVTQSGNLHRDAKLFTRTEVPPLILTCARSLGEIRSRLGSVAEVIDASGSEDDRVDLGTVLDALAERKMFRVLTEGGPHLLSQFIEADLLDELCLSIAPLLVGGGAPRIATGHGHAHTEMRRTHVLTDQEGYLYTRYVRDR